MLWKTLSTNILQYICFQINCFILLTMSVYHHDVDFHLKASILSLHFHCFDKLYILFLYFEFPSWLKNYWITIKFVIVATFWLVTASMVRKQSLWDSSPRFLYPSAGYGITVPGALFARDDMDTNSAYETLSLPKLHKVKFVENVVRMAFSFIYFEKSCALALIY